MNKFEILDRVEKEQIFDGCELLWEGDCVEINTNGVPGCDLHEGDIYTVCIDDYVDIIECVNDGSDIKLERNGIYFITSRQVLLYPHGPFTNYPHHIKIYHGEASIEEYPVIGKKLKMWTTGNKLSCDLDQGTKVYFFSRTYQIPLTNEVYEADGVLVVDVPDVLLTKEENIKVQIDEGDYYQTFEVIRQNKPGDYDTNLACATPVVGFGFDIGELNKVGSHDFEFSNDQLAMLQKAYDNDMTLYCDYVIASEYGSQHVGRLVYPRCKTCGYESVNCGNAVYNIVTHLPYVNGAIDVALSNCVIEAFLNANDYANGIITFTSAVAHIYDNGEYDHRRLSIYALQF